MENSKDLSSSLLTRRAVATHPAAAGGVSTSCNIRLALKSLIHATAGSIVSSFPISSSLYTLNGISSAAPNSTNTLREQSRTNPPCIPHTVRQPSSSRMGRSQRGMTQLASANAQRSRSWCSVSGEEEVGLVGVGRAGRRVMRWVVEGVMVACGGDGSGIGSGNWTALVVADGECVLGVVDAVMVSGAVVEDVLGVVVVAG